jgi:D-ornithine 4,5-aminomutase subunit alpha
MKRQDDFEARRKKIAGLSYEEHYRNFWETTDKVVSPLLELGYKNTTPSIERSVLLRMGVGSLDTKTIVDKCIERGLLGKGAGHVVYKLSKSRAIPVTEAGALLAKGECWDEAAALFGK